MAAGGKERGYFGGYVREMFRDAATIEIDHGRGVEKGETVNVAKNDFTQQSFDTGVGTGDYVEGVVFYDPADEQVTRDFKFITKII